MVNILRKALLVAAMAASVICGSSGLNAAVIDDFSDLNDTNNPTWTHLDGLAGSTGQVWDASTGQYHITAPSNGFVLGVGALGFAGSYTGPEYSDVNVMADFVDFPGGVAWGLAARLSGKDGPGGIDDFNNLTGYAYAYEPFAADGQGEMVLYRIFGLSLQDIGSQQVTLDPNKDYTFVLDIHGSQLHGQVFEIGGGMVAERFATDASYTSGVSGVFSYSQNGSGAPPVDFTIDNFKSQVPEPAAGLLIALGAGVLLLGRGFRRER